MKLEGKVCKSGHVLLFVLMLLFVHQLLAIEIDDLQIVPKVVLDTNGYGVDIALNETDKSLHVAWVRDGDLYYSYRNVTGNWTSPEQIPDGGIVLYGQDDHGNQGTCSTIAASPDGTVHFVYTEQAGKVWYVKGTSGHWSTPITISTSSSLKSNFDMVEANGSLYVTWEEGVTDYQYMCYNINGVWGTPKNLGRGEHTFLTKNETGRVYFLGRSRDTIRNARFGYLQAGQTSLTWVSGATNAVVRLCDAPNVAARNGKLFLAWGDVTGVDGPEKVALHCGYAKEPGTTWTTKLGGDDPLYWENTGSPHPRVEMFDDGTVLFMNGRRMSPRYMIWNGTKWSETREAPWISGKPNLVSDGQTIWVAVAELPGTEVSVSGISLPQPDISDSFQIIAKNIFDSDGFSGDIAINPLNGDVQTTWVHNKSIRFRIKDHDGDWGTIETLPNNNLDVFGKDQYDLPQQCLAMDVDEQGKTHLVFNTDDGDVYYMSGEPGNWSTPLLIEDRPQYTLYPDIIISGKYIYIVYQDGSSGEIRMAEKKNNAWQQAVALGPGSYPTLNRGENGLVYLLYRAPGGKKNARFAFRAPGKTDWIYNDNVTDAADELGDAPALTVGNDKIYLAWNNNSEQSGEFKSQIYCATADEPGLLWSSKLGLGAPLYYENTSMPVMRTAVFTDDKVILFNGRRRNPRFTVWDGFSWSKTRSLAWKEGYAQVAGDGRTAWVITSGISTAADEVSVTGIRNTDADKLNFANANPVITTSPDTLASANTPWFYACSATDDGAGSVSWSLVLFPDGMTINTNSGQVSWTPSTAQMNQNAWNMGAGVHLVGIKVKDVDGGFASQYFWLHVQSNHAPVITSTPVTQAFVDTLYHYQVTAEDADDDAISFSLQQGPTGMSMNATSGLLSWTPTNAQIGDHDITVQVSDVKNAKGTQNFTITVTKIYVPPVAMFNVGTTNQGPIPFTVTFVDQSTGDITAWQWNFGDSTTSTEPDPQHTYTKSGIYTVSLTVTGPAGSDTFIRENFIYAYNPELIAEFSANPTSGPLPLTVLFADSSVGDVTAWRWDFGDNGSSTLQNPQHTFTEPGLYTVKFYISGPAGSDSLIKNDLIHVYNPILVPAFAANHTSGNVPFTVFFSDSSEGDIAEWEWDFGDSVKSNLQNPEHTYTKVGVYTVNLTITGPLGTESLAKINYITVLPPPPDARFSAAPLTGDIPLTVQFSDSSTGEIDAWHWSFGDSVFSNEHNPQHIYMNEGWYTVRLVVNGPGGADTLTVENLIHARLGSGIQSDKVLPTEYALSQNYPNPFNLQTTIEYQVPKPCRVSIRVFDVNGKLVNVLQDGQQSPGTYKLNWQGTDLSGKVCTSGLYLIQLKSPDFTAEKKVILLK